MYRYYLQDRPASAGRVATTETTPLVRPGKRFRAPSAPGCFYRGDLVLFS